MISQHLSESRMKKVCRCVVFSDAVACRNIDGHFDSVAYVQYSGKHFGFVRNNVRDGVISCLDER